jgi:deoxyadenosine/deoxycytidine kinase
MLPTQKNVSIIYITGNIAAGKSTLMSKLAEHFKNVKTMHFRPEKVSTWQYLEGLYRGDENSHIKHQGFVMKDFIDLTAEIDKVHKEDPCTRHLFIVERSVLDSARIFIPVASDKLQEKLAPFIPLCEMYAEMEPWSTACGIFIRSDANKCFRQMKIRDRSEEKGVQLDLLQKLEHQYNLMYREMKEGANDTYLISSKSIEAAEKSAIHIINQYL